MWCEAGLEWKTSVSDWHLVQENEDKVTLRKVWFHVFVSRKMLFHLQKVSSVYIPPPSKDFFRASENCSCALQTVLPRRLWTLLPKSRLIHRPPVFVLVKTSRVLYRRVFSVKEVSLKKVAHLLYYFFNHYFFSLSVNFGLSAVRQGTPAAIRIHESLVIGCRGYSSQTVGLNICLWHDGEKGHLWPSRRVITKVMYNSHIWEDVDAALALRSK